MEEAMLANAPPLDLDAPPAPPSEPSGAEVAKATTTAIEPDAIEPPQSVSDAPKAKGEHAEATGTVDATAATPSDAQGVEMDSST